MPTMTRDLLDSIAKRRSELLSLAGRFGRKDVPYADIRVEAVDAKSAYAENGMPKEAGSRRHLSVGIRVLAEAGGMRSPGYWGAILGPEEGACIGRRAAEGLAIAAERARHNAKAKAASRKRFPELGASMTSAEFAPAEACRDTVPARYKIDPVTVSEGTVAARAAEATKLALSVDKKISYAHQHLLTFRNRRLFVSSEGADLDQSFAVTQASTAAVARGKDGIQIIGDAIGHQRGWEMLDEGVTDDPLMPIPTLDSFVRNIAKEAAELSDCPQCPGSGGKETVLVTDPHYNTLLVHEIVGHPSELDRALKMETGYAGRSWFLQDAKRSQLGLQIASSKVSAYSDPTLPGLGHYKYDDEGTRARRVWIIKNGVLNELMSGRQTAAALGLRSNGSYFVTSGAMVGIIRMNNTVFAGGGDDPGKLISEVDKGYYLVGHKTPSIAESRENFRITARKVYEIKNGRLGRLYRNGGMMAASKSYLMSVDGVGSDFRMITISTCGKGLPMQLKRMANGGPTMRGRGILTGAD
ncbi:MAG: TldD/PmbA family protein [Elusimicrobia bacterium]|nr:TldD/PmbA family protein [Elusimicrobiota bacterium]